MNKTILAIPHIGTAFGHFYRLAVFLDNYIETHRVYIAIPEPFIGYCSHFLCPEIKIIPRKVHCSISNGSGLIDKNLYLALLKENETIYKEIQPDLIIGDPGIQAAILATKFSKEWVGVMHGCYLPVPNSLSIAEEYFKLLKLVWSTLNSQIDKLVRLGTNGIYDDWSCLRSTGLILIPNLRINEPSEIGEYVDLNNSINSYWDSHDEVELLITCCSAGSVEPSKSFLANLARKINCDINVAGINSEKRYTRINYLGNNINYRYLVGKNTTVLTHGGHGTLQAINNAKDVFMIPSDFDQLYNSIIAHAIKGWNLVFDKDWIEIINSGKLFKREIYWNNLNIENNSGKLLIKGLDILEERHYIDKVLIS